MVVNLNRCFYRVKKNRRKWKQKKKNRKETIRKPAQRRKKTVWKPTRKLLTCASAYVRLGWAIAWYVLQRATSELHRSTRATSFFAHVKGETGLCLCFFAFLKSEVHVYCVFLCKAELCFSSVKSMFSQKAKHNCAFG